MNFALEIIVVGMLQHTDRETERLRETWVKKRMKYCNRYYRWNHLIFICILCYIHLWPNSLVIETFILSEKAHFFYLHSSFEFRRFIECSFDGFLIVYHHCFYSALRRNNCTIRITSNYNQGFGCWKRADLNNYKK